jgi:dolichyl-phosphate beta-glucosyltransferase
MENFPLALIIPVYNEENRLKLQEIRAWSEHISIVLVNDGSTDDSWRLMQGLIQQDLPDQQNPQKIFLLNFFQNRGKAEAVRAGALWVSRHLPDTKWVGYADADFSTEISEIFRLMKIAEICHAQAILGSRLNSLGALIKRRKTRFLMSKLLSILNFFLFNFKCYDSQCGAKLFQFHLLEKIFQEPFISKWLFDIEIILRLKEHIIYEIPLMKWIDQGHSKLNVPLSFFQLLSDLLKIKKWQKGLLYHSLYAPQDRLATKSLEIKMRTI